MKKALIKITCIFAWLVTAIAVIASIKHSGSVWWIWLLILPACLKISTDIDTKNDSDET